MKRLGRRVAPAMLLLLLCACGGEDGDRSGSDGGAGGPRSLGDVTGTSGLPCAEVTDAEMRAVFDDTLLPAEPAAFTTSIPGECAWSLDVGEVSGDLYVRATDSIVREQPSYTDTIQVPFSLDEGVECIHYGGDFNDFSRTLCDLPDSDVDVALTLGYYDLAVSEGYGRLSLGASSAIHQAIVRRLFADFFGVAGEPGS